MINFYKVFIDLVCPRPKSNEPSDGESSVRSSAGSKQLQSHINGHNSRPPTLAECESIIKHLQQTNDRQSHEVTACIVYLALEFIHLTEV